MPIPKFRGVMALLFVIALGGCQLITNIIAFGGHTEPVPNPPQPEEPRR